MAYSKGKRGTAERLHAQIVRERANDLCERCGLFAGSSLQCAHIVRRSWAHTCTDEKNAWALCAPCHRLVDNWQNEFMALVIRTIGRTEYERLRQKAQDGVNVKFDWKSEVTRLQAFKAETERKAAW